MCIFVVLQEDADFADSHEAKKFSATKGTVSTDITSSIKHCHAIFDEIVKKSNMKCKRWNRRNAIKM